MLSVCVPFTGYVCVVHMVWPVGSTCLCEYCDYLSYVCVLHVCGMTYGLYLRGARILCV